MATAHTHYMTVMVKGISIPLAMEGHVCHHDVELGIDDWYLADYRKGSVRLPKRVTAWIEKNCRMDMEEDFWKSF